MLGISREFFSDGKVTHFHDGGIFLHRSGGTSLFKAVAAFLAVMMFSTLLIIMIAKGRLFLKRDYWWLLPIVGAEFVVIVIFAYKKTRKIYKRKFGKTLTMSMSERFFSVEKKGG